MPIPSTAPLHKNLAGALALAACLSLPAAPTPAVEGIRILGLFRDKAVVEIDGKRRVLEAGQAGHDGVTLVSATADEAIMEVDGERRSYALGQHISGRYSGPKRHEIEVQVWPDRSGMYYSSGSINGFPVRFLLDTGASAIAMNSHQAKRIGIDYLLYGERSRVSTASGVVESYTVRLRRVRLGDIELRDVSAVVIEGSHPSDVLLGMSFLGRLEMKRDGQIMGLRHVR